MATYKSITEIHGTLGGKVYYQYRGKNCVKEKSGITGSQFRNDASFERARQNSQELGGSSVAGAYIRHKLEPVLAQKREGQLAQTLTGLCRQMMEWVPEPKGKRPVKLSRFAALLNGLRSTGCYLDATREKVAWIGKAPQGATHQRAMVHFFTLGDVVHDAATGKYKPVYKEGPEFTVHHEPVPLQNHGIQVVAAQYWKLLPDGFAAEALRNGETVMCCVLVEFMQVMGGIAYPLETGKGWILLHDEEVMGDAEKGA